MKEFGERLKELRTERGLTTKALGQEIGVSDTTICRWENDRCEVKAPELVKLAQCFCVSTDFLLGLED